MPFHAAVGTTEGVSRAQQSERPDRSVKLLPSSFHVETRLHVLSVRRRKAKAEERSHEIWLAVR